MIDDRLGRRGGPAGERPGAELVGGLEALAGRLRALPPSCGHTRLVAVDGHAGSGKSTFARALSSALGGAPVVHLDDLATHEELFGQTPAFLTDVAGPLSRGEAARHRVYDWTAGAFGARRTVPAADVVLIEGVGAGRRELRPCLAVLAWMDVPREAAHERGRRRDGTGLADFWHRWVRAEDEHFAADPSKPFATLMVHAVSDGYKVRDWSAGNVNARRK